MISAASSATSLAFGQLQRQQAARMAELYEARAASLRAQAQNAQNQADRAAQQADTLHIQANQAQGDADTAKTAVTLANAIGGHAQTQSAQLVRALRAAGPADANASADVGTPGANAGVYAASGWLSLQGQRTGLRVNVSV